MQDDKLFIPILLSTGRNERESEKVAAYVLDQVQAFDFETQLVDVRDHMLDRTTPNWQNPEPSKEWAKIMTRADGLILVIPEYNHGYPGEFKIVFDQLFDEYKKKPVSICSVSSGEFGGVRMIEQVYSVVLSAQMIPTPFAVHFPRVKELFNENWEMAQGEKEKYDKRMKKMLEETEWYARALKGGKKIR